MLPDVSVFELQDPFLVISKSALHLVGSRPGWLVPTLSLESELAQLAQHWCPTVVVEEAEADPTEASAAQDRLALVHPKLAAKEESADGGTLGRTFVSEAAEAAVVVVVAARVAAAWLQIRPYASCRSPTCLHHGSPQSRALEHQRVDFADPSL